MNAGRCRQGGETGRTRPWQDHLCFSSSSPPHHSQSLFPNYLPDLLPDTEGDGAKCRRAGQRCVVIALSTVLSTPQKHTVQTQPFRAASNSKPTKKSQRESCKVGCSCLSPWQARCQAGALLPAPSPRGFGAGAASVLSHCPSHQQLPPLKLLLEKHPCSSQRSKPIPPIPERNEKPQSAALLLPLHEACLHCWKCVKADADLILALCK